MPKPITNNQQPITLTESIFSTLLYHSIFDYPLTVEEVHFYLISKNIVLFLELKKAVKSLLKTKRILLKNGLIVLSSIIHNSSSIVTLCIRRQKISAEKMIIAKRASKTISMIPWVKMVAVTGALAMENADKNDDIDLMIVASKNRLWIVRPLAILLVSLFFKRRYPLPNAKTNNQQPITNNNAICLNLWLDESALEISKSQHNLYTAHELAQMKPIVNRDGIYEEMMWENRWGRKYLANAWGRLKGRQVDRLKNLQHSSSQLFSLFNLLNLLAFNLQFQFMRSKMTNEQVSTHFAFFHPGNRTDTILSEYDRLCHRNI